VSHSQTHRGHFTEQNNANIEKESAASPLFIPSVASTHTRTAKQPTLHVAIRHIGCSSGGGGQRRRRRYAHGNAHVIRKAWVRRQRAKEPRTHLSSHVHGGILALCKRVDKRNVDARARRGDKFKLDACRSQPVLHRVKFTSSHGAMREGILRTRREATRRRASR
jgi:hypothetical protein